MIELNKEMLEDLSARMDVLMPDVQKNSLSKKVYGVLLCLLIDGSIKPGTIFNRREIASSLNVSVAPVLEAMIQLELEGYITTIPRHGTMVNTFTSMDILHNLYLREAYECEAARLYCGKPLIKALDSLIPYAEKLDAAFLTDTPPSWEDELLFHRKLVELSDCPALTKQYSTSCLLSAFYSVYLNLVSSNPDPYEKDLHKNLLMNLTTEDQDEAERFIRYHIQTTMSVIKPVALGR